MNTLKVIGLLAVLSLAGCASAKLISMDTTSNKHMVQFQVKAQAYQWLCDQSHSYKFVDKEWTEIISRHYQLPHGPPGYYLDGEFVTDFSEKGCDVQLCQRVDAEFGDSMSMTEFKPVGKKAVPKDFLEFVKNNEPVAVFQTSSLPSGKYKRVYRYYRDEQCTKPNNFEVTFDYKAE